MDRNHLLQLRDYAQYSERIEELKCVVCELIDILIKDNKPPIDPYRNIYFKHDVDLSLVFHWATEYDDRYEVTSNLGEYLIVYKNDRRIAQSGYNGVIQQWWDNDYLMQFQGV